MNKLDSDYGQIVKDLFSISMKALGQMGGAGAFHHMVGRKCGAADAGINKNLRYSA